MVDWRLTGVGATGWACLLTIVFACRAADAGAESDRYALPAAVSARIATARLEGRAHPNERLPMSVLLALERRHELEVLLERQHRPGTPEFRRWITPAEFTARFAPTVQAYDEIVDWLRGQGFETRPWRNRLRIDFSGSASQVERTFGVRVNRYRDRGYTRLAHAEAPLLPRRFRDRVRHLRLHTFPLAQPGLRFSGPGGVTDTMAPVDMYAAYNMRALLARGLDGSGQTIAVVARSDFNASDVRQFQEQFGVPVRAPVKVFPGKNPGVGAADGVCRGIGNTAQRQQCMRVEEGEVVLDVEWAGAMAPGATVLVDIADTDIDASLMDVVTHHPEAAVISISFTACERLDPTARDIFAPMYAQAAAQGQTVVVATGNAGADECWDGRGGSVNVLASDANVLAVGGTALDPGFDAHGNATAYVSEEVWNDFDGASGAGVSTLVPKPAYQVAPGVPPDGFRDLPDVVLMASVSRAGYAIVLRGARSVVGGTSAATPSWAAIVAIMNQAARLMGSGVINSVLYELGRRQYTGTGAAVFHDVTMGHNNFNGVPGFTAAPGFDVASGLGSPDVAALVQAVAVSACPGDCDGDGIVSITELLAGVNIALGHVPLAGCPAFDVRADGYVTVDMLVASVHRAVNGCW